MCYSKCLIGALIESCAEICVVVSYLIILYMWIVKPYPKTMDTVVIIRVALAIRFLFIFSSMIWNTSFLVKYTQPNDRQCLFFIQLLRNIIFIWFSSAMSLFIIWLRTKFFNCRFIGRVAKSIDQLSKNECMISSIWPLLFSKSVNLLCACNFAHSSFL